MKATKKQKQAKNEARILKTIAKNIGDTFAFLWQQKKLFGGILIIYALLSYVFTCGITQTTFLQLKSDTNDLIAQQADSLGVSTLFLASTFAGESVKGNGELYNFAGFMAFVIFWLVIIWAARMKIAGYAVKIRDAFYNACAPLISTILVSLVALVQLLPAGFGLYLILIVQTGVWSQNIAEIGALTVAGILLVCLSLYFIISSSMAMVIVTIPQMYPIKALKTAGQLVKGKRWMVFMNIFTALLVLLLVWSVVLPGTILLAYTFKIDWLPLVPIVFQLLKAFSMVFITLYIYKFYRSLI